MELFSSECQLRREAAAACNASSVALLSGHGTADGQQRSSGRETQARRLSESAFAGARSDQFPRWKRILDLTCVGLGLPLWLPVIVLIMLLIKIGSPGPIFYRQQRVGYRGKRFMIFKFRSMKVNAEARTHEQHLASLMRTDSPMTKLDSSGDPRLIAWGRILRASGLDELPQIFNVLRGEMSLVGPRPCLAYEFDRYKPWQQERVNAPPGMTGYWQVNGKNKTTFSEMIAMDISYIKNMSLWLDLTIMFKTVPAIIQQVLDAQTRTSAATRAHISLAGEPPAIESQG